MLFYTFERQKTKENKQKIIMWTHHFEKKTNLPLEKLWKVIADVAGWVNIDHNIDQLEINETPKQGAKFKLKPKGGPTLKFVIDTFNPPTEYADLCEMPGAKMKTLHTFERISENETLIKSISKSKEL